MALLRLLDGRLTWRQVLDRLRKQYSRNRFSESNLTAFLVSTINSSLLVSIESGQGDRLTAMLNRERSTQWRRRLMSAISFRWHGIDPTGLLNVTNRLFGWCFNPVAMFLGMVVVCAIAGLMLFQLPQIEAELPRLGQIATLANLPYLVAAFVFVKVFHELGHGTACRRFGGECHELGVLFIAFLPLLYCDVSDAWLFRERWKRVVVSAAGIMVELLFAAVFALLWVMSVPGVLHTFFLNVAIVASVNTLLINGNPLLRYDGYYVLADGFGLPNLSPESRRSAGYIFDRVVLGIPRERVSQGSPAGELGLIAFGLASAIYRLFVVGVILWVVYETLRPYGFEFVAQIMAVATVAGIGVSGVQAMKSRAKIVAASGGSYGRSLLGCIALGLVVAAVLLTPFPRTVSAPFTVTEGESAPVYVTAGGRIVSAVEIGTYVEAGDIIATLENAELQLSLADAEGDVATQTEHLQQLLNLRRDDTEAAQEIPVAQKAVATAASQLNTIRKRHRELVIRAERSGVVLPPRNRVSAEGLDGNTPLNAMSRGAWLEPQTLLCWVGDAEDVRLEASVEETAVSFVKAEAITDVAFSSAPGDELQAVVEKVSSRPQDQVSRELVMTRAIATSDATSGRPNETRYRIDLRLDAGGETASTNAVVPAPLYSTGNARIHCDPECLAMRIWRLICHTFAIRV